MPNGRGWDPAIREAALELMAEGLGPAAVRDRLLERFDRAPGLGTLRGWRREAGVAASDPKKAPAPSADGVAARLVKLGKDRELISEALLTRLTRPAVELIARRLEEEVETVLPRIEDARTRVDDAAELLASLSDAPRDGELYKGAARYLQQARLIYQAETGLALPVRDLVGIVTRSVADHLLLEGIAADLEEFDSSKSLTVELVMPRPDRAKAERAAKLEDDLGVAP